MGSSTHRIILAIVTVILMLGTGNVSAETKSSFDDLDFIETTMRPEALKSCRDTYKNQKISPVKLMAIINRHKAWLRDYDTETKRKSLSALADPRFAYLCGADLSRVDLSGTDLRYANLAAANLIAANLRGANLEDADLKNANLQGANLTKAKLSRANFRLSTLANSDLSGAEMWRAHLEGAIFWNANFTDATLSQADLQWAWSYGANLRNADLWNADLRDISFSDVTLSGANLEYANVGGVEFEPKDLPLIDRMALARHLDLMFYKKNPQGLIKLRKAFKEAGYTEPERAITTAIKRSEQWRGGTAWNLLEGIFKYVFFDLPTQWGLYPWQALRTLLILIGVFSLPYILALRYPGNGTIYRKWGVENLPAPTTSTWRNKHHPASTAKQDTEPLQYSWGKAIRRGIQFSLISAFRIGFREFNIGNWISRLQPRDYTLYATGWVRSIAGIQALISVYLLAMWALTYFGRPFE